MDKDLPDIDITFNRAYQQFREEPSAGSWDKIIAILDKDDAVKYKKRSVGWKRISILLLLLLAGMVIYEGDIQKNRFPAEDVLTNTKHSDINIQEAKRMNKSSNSLNKNIKEDVQKVLSVQSNKINSANLNSTKKSVREIQVMAEPIIADVNDKTYPIQHSETKHQFTDQQQNVSLAGIEKKYDTAKEHTSIIQSEDSFLNKKTTGVDTQSSLLTEINPGNLAINERVRFKKPVLVLNSLWNITAFVSSELYQFKLDDDTKDNGGNNHDEKNEINQREKHEPSFSSGVFLARNLNKAWGLKTGLIYSSTSITINPHEMYASLTPNGSLAYKYVTSSGYSYLNPGFGQPPALGDSLKSSEAQHNLISLSVPVMLTYTYARKKISISPSAGVSANYIIKATVQTEIKNGVNRATISINRLEGMRNFYLGFVTDVNMRYAFNNKWSFSLLPFFKYAISPITKNNVVKTYPYSFGVGAGINYKF